MRDLGGFDLLAGPFSVVFGKGRQPFRVADKPITRRVVFDVHLSQDIVVEIGGNQLSQYRGEP